MVMSGMVADVQQPAVWRSVVPATVHTLAVLALPGVSLADRSPRRVPGHSKPLRSRALLSSNHGVSRRQAGAATYGRFSVRPLGPLRVWPRGALGLWLDARATDTFPKGAGAQSCADTPTRVRAHRRANPVNETLSVQFSSVRRCGTRNFRYPPRGPRTGPDPCVIGCAHHGSLPPSTLGLIKKFLSAIRPRWSRLHAPTHVDGRWRSCRRNGAGRPHSTRRP